MQRSYMVGLVSGLDWIIVGFAALLAVYGFRQGFIVAALSFAGLLGGAFLGTRLGPLLLSQGSSSPYAPAFGLAGAVLAGGILATGLEGLGLRLRGGLRLAGIGLLDGAVGALFSAAVGLGVVWIAAAVLAQAQWHLQLRREIQQSVILRTLNELLPPSGVILNALSRLDPLPQIAGPSPDVLAAPPALARTLALRAASRSVVRVLGSACGLAVEGSGWVVRQGLVVTNAHVVAGEQDTVIQVAAGEPDLPVRVVAFDAHDDLALLRVANLRLASLSMVADPQAGSAGAILGYPENGPFDAHAGRIGVTQQVLTQDAYGRGPVRRLLTPLRGLVRPGNSGGPLVDSEGRVLTTIFAGTLNAASHGGYGVANATVRQVVAGATASAVSTGECAG
jgi:S1-C subfamily serine protease